MTPEERAEASFAYLRCCEMVSHAREDGDIARLRHWEAKQNQWYYVLRREEMHPERGPQGDAAC